MKSGKYKFKSYDERLDFIESNKLKPYTYELCNDCELIIYDNDTKKYYYNQMLKPKSEKVKVMKTNSMIESSVGTNPEGYMEFSTEPEKIDYIKSNNLKLGRDYIDVDQFSIIDKRTNASSTSSTNTINKDNNKKYYLYAYTDLGICYYIDHNPYYSYNKSSRKLFNKSDATKKSKFMTKNSRMGYIWRVGC